MIVQLRDGTELVVSSERAKKLKEAIEADAKGIDLGTEWFRADYVVRIKPGGSVEDNNKRIEAPDYRGKPSPAKEKLRQQLKQKGIL